MDEWDSSCSVLYFLAVKFSNESRSVVAKNLHVPKGFLLCLKTFTSQHLPCLTTLSALHIAVFVSHYVSRWHWLLHNINPQLRDSLGAECYICSGSKCRLSRRPPTLVFPLILPVETSSVGVKTLSLNDCFTPVLALLELVGVRQVHCHLSSLVSF